MKTNLMRIPALCLLLVLGAAYFALALVALLGMMADGCADWVDRRSERIGAWGIRGHG